MDTIQGIWFEEARCRWRVKLFKDGALYHRSYHHSFSEARETWETIKKELALPRPSASEIEPTLIQKFLRQPVLRADGEDMSYSEAV